MLTHDLQIEKYDPTLQFQKHLDPWEKQDGEDDRAWIAFVVYRDLPPSERTLAACGRILRGNPDLKWTPDWVSVVAKANRWSERVAAYDRWRDATMRHRLEERMLERRIAASDLAEDIFSKIAQAVSAIKSVIEVEIRDEEGNVTSVETRAALSPNEIASLAKLAKDLEVYAFGESHQGQPGAVHIQNALFQVGDNTLVERAQEVVTRQREVIDAIPFDIIGSGTDDASGGSSARYADLG